MIVQKSRKGLPLRVNEEVADEPWGALTPVIVFHARQLRRSGSTS